MPLEQSRTQLAAGGAVLMGGMAADGMAERLGQGEV